MILSFWDYQLLENSDACLLANFVLLVSADGKKSQEFIGSRETWIFGVCWVLVNPKLYGIFIALVEYCKIVV